jgi:hypothetical protein
MHVLSFRRPRPALRNDFADQAWRGADRAGMSTIFVMVSMSMSVVLAYAFLQNAAVSVQIASNANARSLALQAAQAGAAAALQEMQSPTWAGVSSTLGRNLTTAPDGTASYSVQYLPDTSPAGQSPPEDAGLRVVVLSTGKWQSASNSQQLVLRQVQVVARLQPRPVGRPTTSGDLAAAEDLTTNPQSYDFLQAYTLLARNSGSSLVTNPGTRIDGKIWVRDNLDFFTGPAWSGSTLDSLSSAIGSRFVTTVSGQPQYSHPHPLTGDITFRNNPSGNVKDSLARLGTLWSKNSTTPTFPSINYSNWQQYQLYSGGFTYTATTVSSRLQSVTLRPSAQNPLGIFYCNGSISLGDDVVIQGTLVANGQVSFSGNRICVCAFDWQSSQGKPIAANANLYPRLPAIVAESVWFDRDNAATVEGAVVLNGSLSGAGGTFEYQSTADLTVTGTATSQPVQQPWSDVQLLGTPNLTGVTGGNLYAIWLSRGTSGNWYPIVSVDAPNYKFRVLGEVLQATSTSFKIRRNRQRYVDIRGPLLADSYNFFCAQEWTLGSTGWSTLTFNWQQTASNVNFSTWLENPVNFVGLLYPPYTHAIYGLTLEPTTHVRNTTGITYNWSPPLFEPYQATGTNAAYAGYRWKILSWRELP